MKRKEFNTRNILNNLSTILVLLGAVIFSVAGVNHSTDLQVAETLVKTANIGIGMVFSGALLGLASFRRK